MAGLSSRIEAAENLTDDMTLAMYALYTRYYDGTSEQHFRRDLSEKQYVIILSDDGGRLQGFSTATVNKHQFQGQPLRSFFSGDTIIDASHWGQQALPRAWFQLTGHIKSVEPDTPLYWFLLVKGHRTYRYLPAFFNVFFPSYDKRTPTRDNALMDMLAEGRYGDAYDRKHGVVRFETSQGHLKSTWADVPKKDLRRPDVKFFLERNPGYINGDELVCLAELTTGNLRPLAQRPFLLGMNGGI